MNQKSAIQLWNLTTGGVFSDLPFAEAMLDFGARLELWRWDEKAWGIEDESAKENRLSLYEAAAAALRKWADALEGKGENR